MLGILVATIEGLLAAVGAIMVFGSRWAVFLLNFISMSDMQYPANDTIKHKPKTNSVRFVGVFLLLIGISLFFYGLSNF